MRGAIFFVTVPGTIMRSHWRGDARDTSEPKRLMSKFEPCVEIISMAQQARPNVNGQSELERPQLKILEATVTRMPSFCSSTTMGMRSDEGSNDGTPSATWCEAPDEETGRGGAVAVLIRAPSTTGASS